MSTFGPYSPIYKAGNLYFVSGQVGVDPETKTSASDIETQTRQALENMKKLLEQNDLTMNDIAKTTVFITDMDNFVAMNEVYKTYFDAPRPARSTIGVNELPRVGTNKLLVEIEAVAMRAKDY